MKILLQDRQTLHYLRTVNSWTKHPSEAHNFLHSQKAIDFAHEHKMENVYVTVAFLGGEPEVAIPLPEPSRFLSSQARLY